MCIGQPTFYLIATNSKEKETQNSPPHLPCVKPNGWKLIDPGSIKTTGADYESQDI